MPGYERSAMASRRVRRNAMGTSNTFRSADDNEETTAAAASATGPSERMVSLVQSGLLHKAPASMRPNVLSESKPEDRATFNHVHDKLFKSRPHTFIQKILRSYDTDKSGMLSHGKFKSALDRLHMGLSEDDKEKIVRRVDPAGQGAVDYKAFLASFEVPNPLGSPLPGKTEYNLSCKAPWDEAAGVPRAWEWGRRHAPQMPGLEDDCKDGTVEQMIKDAQLVAMITARLAQKPVKVRNFFRLADADCDSHIGRAEWAPALSRFKMNLTPAQEERLFHLVDKDGDGLISYKEFAKAFDGSCDILPPNGSARPMGHGASTSGRTAADLASELGFQPGEAESMLIRDPSLTALKRNLYNRGTGAYSAFLRYDLHKDGLLSLEELTKCCQQLSPGISERQVGAVMLACDGNRDGYIDYKEFVRKLVDAGSPPHPRLLSHAAGHDSLPHVSTSAVQADAHSDGGPPHAESCASPSLLTSTSSSYRTKQQQPQQQQQQQGGFGGNSSSSSSSSSLARTSSMVSTSGKLRGGQWGDSPLGVTTLPTSSFVLASLAAEGLLDFGQPVQVTAPVLSRTASYGHDSRTGGSAVRTCRRPLTQLASRMVQHKVGTGAAAETAQAIHELSVAPLMDSMERCASAPGLNGSNSSMLRASMPEIRTLSAGGSSLAGTGHVSQRYQNSSMSQSVDAGGGLPGPFGASSGPTGFGANAATKLAAAADARYRAMHPDTRHVTSPLPATASHADVSETFVRKGAPGFYTFLDEDRSKKASRAAAYRDRFATVASIEQEHAGRDGQAEARDAVKRECIGQLQVAYQERAMMYDRVRHAEDKAGSCIFGRFPEHHTHQDNAIGSNNPTRYFW